MSFGGNYGGGKTRFATKVVLNVYDLAPANDYLYPIGMGLHHSGVEILGSEYSFASGAGVFSYPPKEVPGARFRQQIEMGAFNGGQAELKKALAELQDDFGPEDYNLIRRNCNHFANALCWKLLNKPIPGFVNRLADLGMCCRCLLPRSMLEHAPVGDPNDVGGAPESRFMVRPGRTSPKATSSSFDAFSGGGARLGGGGGATDPTEKQSFLKSWTTGSSSSSSNRSSPQDDLTDRRERARKAALARMERSQQAQKES